MTKRTKTGKKQKTDLRKNEGKIDTSMGKYYLENELKSKQKQSLIDMMRGDEEIGLYDDNTKNH